ncbi:hypothetical protein Q5752_001542 [Cryptotrichosporon argae]
MTKLSSRPFQILALPLARVPRAAPVTRPAATPTAAPAAPTKPSPLVLYQVLQPEAIATADDKPPLVQRALQKASDQWLKLGQKDKNSWMYWFYHRGEKLMDRIEYEEWALKGVVEGQGVKIDKDGKVVDRIEIPLLRPTIMDVPPLLPKLHRSLLHRIPFHRKMMIRFLVGSPLTWPFALLPVVPNFPLFYVLWRAWSHYKAYRGATYLDALIKAGLIVEKPSAKLDEIYAAHGVVAPAAGAENAAPDATAGRGDRATVVEASRLVEGTRGVDVPEHAAGAAAPDGTTTPKELIFHADSKVESHRDVRSTDLLLSKGKATLLREAFELRPNEVNDINRAIEQAEQRVKAADRDIEDKAKEAGAGAQ